MSLRGAEALQGVDMKSSAITHMTPEAIAGVTLVETTHDAVAVHLGDDRGSRDRAVDRVTVNQGSLGDRNARHRARIDEQMVRRG